MKNLQKERDEFIEDYHVEPDPSGLKCPVCGSWSAADFSSPQGVKIICEKCGAKAIMPRVQLIRAIKKVRKGGNESA